MGKSLNCPNCGAPITGIKCEYCGTMFYDFAEISQDNPKFLRLNFNGKKIWGKAIMQSANVVIEHDSLPVVEVNFLLQPDKDGNIIYFQEQTDA